MNEDIIFSYPSDDFIAGHNIAPGPIDEVEAWLRQNGRRGKVIATRVTEVRYGDECSVTYEFTIRDGFRTFPVTETVRLCAATPEAAALIATNMAELRKELREQISGRLPLNGTSGAPH